MVFPSISGVKEAVRVHFCGMYVLIMDKCQTCFEEGVIFFVQVLLRGYVIILP